ncbi:MAG: LacI family DNA-binding transcriptional regulator [Melioribacteraceae bacterium]
MDRKHKRNKVTLKDIARELSLTPATVSKALRDSTDISEKTKQLVKEKCKEMKYRPNILARSLITNRSKILGVLIPDLRISFFSEAVRGMYEEASNKGYECILMVHDEDIHKERKKIEFLSDIGVDGILLNAAGGNENLSLYKSLDDEGIKIVCWDRKLNKLPFTTVKIDDVDASFALTSKMIKEGRRNILFLGPNTLIPVCKDRFQGYKKALKKFGIKFNPKLVLETFRSVEDSYNKMSALLDSKIKIDAVISIGGLITYGAGKAILDKKLSIPDDILLGEFGDNTIVARLGVPYYTVDQNPYTIGKTATDILIDMLDNKKDYKDFDDVTIQYKIVER